jgi:hypothetical protein
MQYFRKEDTLTHELILCYVRVKLSFVTDHKSSQIFYRVHLQYKSDHPVKQRNRMESTGSWREILPACQSFLQKSIYILLYVDVQVSFAAE